MHAEKQHVKSLRLGSKHRSGRWHYKSKSVSVGGVEDADPGEDGRSTRSG